MAFGKLCSPFREIELEVSPMYACTGARGERGTRIILTASMHEFRRTCERTSYVVRRTYVRRLKNGRTRISSERDRDYYLYLCISLRRDGKSNLDMARKISRQTMDLLYIYIYVKRAHYRKFSTREGKLSNANIVVPRTGSTKTFDVRAFIFNI